MKSSLSGCATGSSADKSLTGTLGINYTNGDGGHDKIANLAGNDNLNGNDGNDLLSGGDGNDELTGGNNAGEFQCGLERDKITDFRGYG